MTGPRWRKFHPRPYDPSKGIELGALIWPGDSNNKQQLLFLGPNGGGIRLLSGTDSIQIISYETPLGSAMMGKFEDDEISLQVAPIQQHLEVLKVH